MKTLQMICGIIFYFSIIILGLIFIGMVNDSWILFFPASFILICSISLTLFPFAMIGFDGRQQDGPSGAGMSDSKISN